MPFSVYVIKLKREVLAEPKFAKSNPLARSDKPCLYVGSTALTPAKRYEKHLAGIKSNRFVRDYHDGLHQRLTAKSPAYATRPEAEAREAQFAEALRAKRYGVWYGVAPAKPISAEEGAAAAQDTKAAKPRGANKPDSVPQKAAKARKPR